MACRHRLLARTAFGSVALLAAGPGFTLPGDPVNIAVNPGGSAPIFTPGAGTLDIDFNAARTVLQYNGFTVGQGETVNLRFDTRGDIGVIHNVGQEGLSIDGVLRSYVGAEFGGNVWLLSSTGVFFGANAQVDVGGLLASTAIPTNLLSTEGGFLDTTTLSFDFANGAGQITVGEGARLTGNGGSLAFIAPVVRTNAGSSIGGGGNTSVLYGAAERFTVRFVREAGNDLDLLDFEVPGLSAGSDSSVPLSILGSTAAGNIYLASVGKVATVSAVLSVDASLIATSAGVEGGSIVLTSGGGIASRAAGPLLTDGINRQSIDARGDFTATQSITAQATGEVSAFGDIRTATGSIVMTGTTVRGSSLTAGQDIVLRAGDAVGSTGYGNGYGVYGPQGGFVGFDRVSAGDDVLALAWNGDVSLNSVILAGTGPDLGGDPLGLDAAGDGRRLLMRTTGDFGDVRLGASGEGFTDALTGGTDTRLDSTGLIRVVSSGAVTLTEATARGTGSSNLDYTEFRTNGALSIGTVTARGAIVAVSDTTVAIGSATTSFDSRDNGQIAVRGGTTATLTSADAASDVIVIADGGDATVGTVRAGDDVIVRAFGGGTAWLTGATVATGDTDGDGEGEGFYGPDRDGNRINTGYGNGYGFAIFGDLNFDSDFDGRRIDLAALTLFQGEGVPPPGGDVRLGLGTGQLFGASDVSVEADRDVFVDLIGDVVVNRVEARRDIVAAGAGRLDIGFLSAGLDASVTARTGDAYVSSGEVARDLTIAAPGAQAAFGEIGVGRDLLLTGVEVGFGFTGGYRDAGGPRNVTIRTTGGDIRLGSVAAGRDIVLDAVGEVDVFGLDAGQSIRVTATGEAAFGIGEFDRGEAGQILANLDFTVDASNILIRPGTQVTVGRDATLTATGRVDIQTLAEAGDDFRVTAPTIVINALYAGSGEGIPGSDSEGDGRNIVLAGTTIDAIRLTADDDVRATATGKLGIGLDPDDCESECDVGGVNAGRDALLSGGSFRLDAPIVAGNDASLSSTTGSLDLTDETVDADRDLILNSTGGITLGDASADRDIRLTATTFAIADGLRAGRDLSVDAADIRVGLGSAGQSETGSVVLTGGSIAAGFLGASGDVRATATGALTISTTACTFCEGSGISVAGDIVLRGASLSLEGFFSAGRDISLTTTVAGFSSTGSFDGGRDVIVDAAGALTLGTVTAMRDIVLTGASVNVGQILPGQDARVTARGGDAIVGAANTPRDLTVLAALGLASLGTGNVGGNLLLSGATVALGSIDAFVPEGYGYGGPVPTFDITIAATTGGFSYGGTLAAANDLRITVGGALALSGTTSAARDLVLDGGSVAVAGAGAGRDLSITARTGTLTASAALTAGDDVRLTGPTIDVGMVTVTTAQADTESDGRTIVVAGGNVAAGALTSDGDVTMTASGGIALASARAGDDIVLGAGGAVGVTGALLAGLTGQSGTGPDSEADGQNIRVTGGAVTLAGLDAPTDAVVTGDDVAISNVATRRDAVVTARTGDAVVLGAAVRRDLRVVAAGGLARIGTATVGRDLLLSGLRAQLGGLGGYLEAGQGYGYGYGQTLIPTRDIAIAATAGDFSFGGTLAADRDLDIRATGVLTLGTVTARDDVRLGGGAVTVATARALGGNDSDGDGSNLVVAAASLDATMLSAATDVRITTSGQAALAQDGGGVDARDIVVDAGRLTTGRLTATQDLRLTTAGDLAAIASQRAGRDALIDAGGTATLASASAIRDVIVTGASLDLGGVSAGRDLSLTATASGFSASDLSAVRNLTVDAAGPLSFLGASAGGDLRLTGVGIDGGSATAGGDATLDSRMETLSAALIRAGDDIRVAGAVIEVEEARATGLAADSEGDGSDIVAAGGAVTLEIAVAANDILATGSGAVALGIASDGGATGGGGTYFADANGDIVVSGTSVLTGPLTAGRDVALTARSGGIDGRGPVAAGRDIVATASGAVAAATLDATRDIVVTGAGATLDQVDAGQDARVSATVGDAVVTRADVRRDLTVLAALGLAQVGDAAVGQDFGLDGARVALGSLSGYANSGDGDGDGLSPTRDVTLTATAGDITGGASLGAARDMRVTASGAIALGDLTAGGLLDANAGGALGTGALSAGGDLRLAGASLTTGNASAGGDLTATARSGNASLGNAAAGDDVRISAALDLALGTVNATGSAADSENDGRNIVLDGRAITLVSATASDDVRITAGGALTVAGAGAAIVAGRDAILVAPSLSPGGISAGRDLSLTATASGISAGSLGAARDLTLDAAGALTFGDVTAARDLRLAGASVDGGNADAGGSIAVMARSGNAGLGTLTAGGSIGVDAAGAIGLGDVSGSDIVLAGTAIDAAIVAAAGDFDATARGGDAVFTAVTAGDDIGVTATGAVRAVDLRTDASAADTDGGGSNIVVAAGDIALDGGNAATDLDLSSTGAVALGSFSTDPSGAGRDVRLSGARIDAVARAGRDLIATGGAVTLSGGADRDVSVTGTGLTLREENGRLDGGALSAGDDVRIAVGGGNVIGAAITADGGVDGEGDGGNVVIDAGVIGVETMFATTDVILTSAAELVTGGGIMAGRDARLTAASLVPGSISAGRDLILTATAGSIAAGDLSAARDLIADATGVLGFGSLTATRDLVLSGSGLDGRGATAGGDVTATARSGGILLADTRAGDDVRITAAQDVTLGGVTAMGAGADNENDGSNIVVAGRAVTLVAASAPGDVSVTATGALVVTGTGNPISAGRDAILSAASLSPAGVAAGRDVSLIATASGITGVTLGAVRNLTVSTAGPLSFGTATAGGALTLTATSLAGTTATAGTDLTATVTGALTLATATAGDDVRLTGGSQSLGTVGATGFAADSEGDGSNVVLNGGGVAAAQLSAATDIRVTGTGAVSVAQASAGRDVIVTGGSVGGVLQLSGRDIAITTGGAFAATSGLVATRDLRLTAGTTLSFAQLAAARDLILSAPVVQGGTAVATRDLTVIATTRIAGDRFEAGRTLVLDPDEAITAAVVRSGGDATLIGRSIDVGILDVGGVTFAQATNGGVALDTFTGRGAATLMATGRVSLGASTTGSLRIAAGDLDVRRSLVASSLQVETPGRMVLGGVEGDTGFVLAAADIARLRVAGIASFYAALTTGQSDSLSASGDLIVRDFGYAPADLPRLALYADRGRVVDVQGRVLPSVGGGFIQIGDANPLGRFRPDSVFVSGSFGFAELDVNCFGKVVAVGELAFYAVNDVIFGLADFRAAIRATAAADIDLVDNQPAVTGPRDDRLFAVANRFTVDAAGKIVSQNTASSQGNYVGLFFNGTGTTGPIVSLGSARAIDLSGSLVDGAGNLRSGPTVAFAGELGSGLGGARFNGCLIGATSCGAGGNGATPSEALRLEDYTPPRPIDLTDQPLSTIMLVDQQPGTGDTYVAGSDGGGIVIRRRPGGN